jgi:CheY-like chemotaxis protein
MKKMKPRSILMFDEDYESMHDVKEYMEEELGWTVVLSAEPSVLELLRTERFDLVSVDLMIHARSFDDQGNEVANVSFPDVSWLLTGLEVLRRLRRGDYVGEGGAGTPSDVPVIMLSAVAGYAVEPDPSLDIGEYVEKPFRLDDMVEKMQRLLKE